LIGFRKSVGWLRNDPDREALGGRFGFFKVA
jgi:hypothetical protein